MRNCSHCNTTKPLTEFAWINYLGKRKDQLDRVTTICNSCRAVQKIKGYQTLEGKLIYLYKHQVKSSKQRGHSNPEYTQQEFINKYVNDPLYTSLFLNWVKHNYDTYLAPSLDRMDEIKGYSFDNIQLMTWGENCAKEHKLHKEGKSLNTDLKPVWQYSLEGHFINYYISQAEAARNVEGVTQQTISKCCLKEIYRAGRYRWFFEEQTKLEPINIPEDYSLIYEYCAVNKTLITIYLSLKDITDSIHDQTSIRRAIRSNKLHKERIFSNKPLSHEDIVNFISNMKGISPIVVYDLEFNKLNEFRSSNEASKVLSISDSTIKRYALNKTPYLDFNFRLKFDDNIQEHRHKLINCQFLGGLDE